MRFNPSALASLRSRNPPAIYSGATVCYRTYGSVLVPIDRGRSDDTGKQFVGGRSSPGQSAPFRSHLQADRDRSTEERGAPAAVALAGRVGPSNASTGPKATSASCSNWITPRGGPATAKRREPPASSQLGPGEKPNPVQCVTSAASGDVILATGPDLPAPSSPRRLRRAAE